MDTEIKNYILETQKDTEFTLYHIKGKKWGCTCRLTERLKEQGYKMDDVCETKSIIGILNADKLEEELNKKFGYPFNKSQSYLTVYYRRVKGTKDAWDRGVYNHIDFKPNKQTLKKLSDASKEMWKDPTRKLKNFRGTKHPQSKFTEEDIRYIRKISYPAKNQNTKAPKGKLTSTQLAKKFNCSRYIITNIMSGKTYKSVK